MKRYLISLASFFILYSCTEEVKKPIEPAIVNVTEVPTIEYTVAATLPHDTLSFTEGLFFDKGRLFESTGSPDDMPETRSLWGITDMKTGKIDVKAELDRKIYFGEGIILFGNKLFQLTYRNQKGFIYDAGTFRKTGEFSYANKEGWGLTSDGKNLIMSDGTNTLTYLDPTTTKPVKTLVVTENGYASDYLNELEFIKGFIYANVWTTNSIVKIDPNSGKIVGKLFLSPLVEEVRHKYKGAKEMNGIAYNAEKDQIFITGKMWPLMYQLSFSH